MLIIFHNSALKFPKIKNFRVIHELPLTANPSNYLSSNFFKNHVTRPKKDFRIKFLSQQTLAELDQAGSFNVNQI